MTRISFARGAASLGGCAMVLGLLLAPTVAQAFRCDSTLNPAGASGAVDNGTALSTACGTNVNATAAGAVAFGTDTD